MGLQVWHHINEVRLEHRRVLTPDAIDAAVVRHVPAHDIRTEMEAYARLPSLAGADKVLRPELAHQRQIFSASDHCAPLSLGPDASLRETHS